MILTDEEAKRLSEDPEYVVGRRFNNSIRAVEVRYPAQKPDQGDRAPDHVVAQALGMREAEVEPRVQGVLARLRLALAGPELADGEEEEESHPGDWR